MTFEKDVYINPLTDFGFKMLFGSEPNKAFLMDFLNQLLPAKHHIKTLTYSKNEHLGVDAVDRKAIFDIYCQNEQGDKFIVEIQKAKQNFFKDRSVFYSSFPIQEQGKRGEWDFKLSAIYTIGILDFTFSENSNSNKYIHYVKLKDQDNKVFYDKLTYIYIELPKFTLNWQELKTKKQKWLYLFRHIAKLQDRPIKFQEKVFTDFFNICEIAKLDKPATEAYENSLKYYRDIQNSFITAIQEGLQQGIEQGLQQGIEQGLQQGIEQGLQQGIEQGLQQGIEQGLQQGIEQGLQQGIEQGLQQGIEQGLQQGIEEGRKAERETMARKLLAQNLAVNTIADLTGLSVEYITKISNRKN